MNTQCKDIINFIEDFAPKSLAEDWDNVGLLLGSNKNEVRRVMVCLDATSETIDDAISKKADMIITHHPIIFKGLKRIDTDDFIGKNICKLIKNDIGVYSAHTNLDMAFGGVNECLARVLGIDDLKDIKKYKTEKLFKVVVYVPEENVDVIRDSMCNEGAGWIGNYSDCSFITKGTGTFKPLEGTNPYIGSQGKLEKVNEYKLETVVAEKNLKDVIQSMIKVHPYEEVAYDIYPLQLNGKEYGLGKIGVLKDPVSMNEFIRTVKNKLNTPAVRLIGSTNTEIQKVAVFCGSFDESLTGLIINEADILVTGDIKYHTALELIERGLCTVDAGHFNTEQVIVLRLLKVLGDKFPNVEFFNSDMEKDPFKFI